MPRSERTPQPTPAAAEPHHLLAAALWMAGSILSISLVAVATRMVIGHHGVLEILAYRSLTGVVLVVTVAGALGRLGDVRCRRLGLHGARNLTHFAGQVLWFWAVTQIPLAKVFALEFTSPVWVILFAPLALGERLTALKLFAGILGLGGILVVARPDFGHVDAGTAAATASAIFFAAMMILTKRLTRSEGLVAILFWLTLMQTVMAFSLALAFGGLHWPTAATLPWLLLIGAGGLAGHLSQTMALSLAPASFVSPIDFLRLPLIAVVGVVLYDEGLTTGLVAGSLMILSANLISVHSQRRVATAPPGPPLPGAGAVPATRPIAESQR